MSEEQFRRIAGIAHREAGLVFPPGKAPLVSTRLNRRLRALGLSGFAAYCDFLDSPEGAAERRMMISALTTNVSSFFREDHHFGLLRSEILPPLLDRARSGGRVRLWSAGCAAGQEAYSIAMVLAALEPGFAKLDIRILASDIDPEVLRRGRDGWYDEREQDDIPENYRRAFLTPCVNAGRSGIRISGELRRLVSFRELNLLDAWPMKGPFDVIFCRNVVIYFDGPTQERLWNRFRDICAPGGWLIVGHSERLPPEMQGDFPVAGPTAYRYRPAPGEDRRHAWH